MAISRRNFLKLCSIGAAGLALRAPAHTAARRRVRVLAVSDAAPLQWPATIRTLTGIEVSVEIAGSPDALAARLQARSGGYDLLISPARCTSRLIITGALQRLDLDLIPSAQSLPTAFATGRRAQDPANAFSLPAATDALGLIYRPDAFARPPHSWRTLREHARRLALPDDAHLAASTYPRAFAAALRRPSTATMDALQNDMRYLRTHAHISSDPVRWVRSGAASLAIGPIWMAAPGLAFSAPLEGSPVRVVDYAIPRGSTNVSIAHTLIDWSLTHFPPSPLPVAGAGAAPLLPRVSAMLEAAWREAA
ncbi:MAG: PotD/PotF family extracellular solute-binding protein [Anaerolineales bacterium]